MENGQVRLVIYPHDRHYADPIRLKKGEPFTLSGRSIAWGGNAEHIWLWAIGTDGREGWVAKDFPQMRDGQAYAPFDYDALELSVVQGEMVDVLEEKLGWALCKNSQNNTGWVPLRVFG